LRWRRIEAVARSRSRCGAPTPISFASCKATSTVAVTKLIVEPLGRCVWASKS